MRIKLFLLLLPALFCCNNLFAQDFSNKGKEFWLSYSYHVGMSGGAGSPTMTIYITSDQASNFKVEVYGGSMIQTGTLASGQVASVTIPTALFINDEGHFTNRAVRVTADKPVVVYSYITRSQASGATLCLPTNVLGKEYYSFNFTQNSNEPNSNSYFTIIAVEDNTTVEITPSATTKKGWLAGNTYTVNLNKGEIFQVLGLTPNNNGVDLTGSRIRSVAGAGGGCKRIAVFSGSGKIGIGCTGGAGSSDNLYQQLYPTGSWGKKYLTVPSAGKPNNYYRIIKNDPSTNVYLNGTLIPASSFTNGLSYQFLNTTPNSIEADKPISVAQYFTTQNCAGNGSPYDPDMIVLNPVEQNIDKVTLVSSNLYAPQTNMPHEHHIHVIMKNGGTGISSFTFDGTAVPASSWLAHPNAPGYSYLYLTNVSQGYHRLSSDSGFNALAYGYGNAESYGYSGGANVKDLYQFVSIQNQYASVNFPATCRNAPFYFSMTFPYQPTQVQWQFGGLFTDVSINSPVYDSTWFVNGRQLYRYKLSTPYTIAAPGTYPIKVIASNPTSDGCSGEQEISYDLQVFDPPTSDFSFTTNGCVSTPVQFTDNANTTGRPVIKYSWNFGDGNTSAIRNPSHQFGGSGSHVVKYSVITDVGCLSDTTEKTVVLSQPPIARFGVSAPNCVGKSITFTDSSSTASSSITKWYWNFGDGSPQIVATSNAPQTHIYSITGSYNVTLEVETATGCRSTVFTNTINIKPNPVASFSFGNACLPGGQMQFTNSSTIPDGTQNGFTYQWNFGDGGTSILENPVHNFSSTGPFNVRLTVTSNSGCPDDSLRVVNTIYAQPQATINAPAEVCLGGNINFSQNSSASGSTVAQWVWEFGDGNTSNAQSPSHTYSSPGTYNVTLVVTSAIGCTSAVATKQVVVNPLPTANFTTSLPSCVTKNITFTDASFANAGGVAKWNWDMGDGTTLLKTTNAPFTHIYSSTGTYNVTLQAESDKGCISTIFSKLVTVSPLPVAAFGTPENCLTDPFSQFTDSSIIADGTESQFTYLWNFGDPNATASNPNTSTQKNPSHRYTQTATYNVSLTVTSNSGCIATITQPFTINGDVPQSAFTVQGGNDHCSDSDVRVINNSTVDFGSITRIEIYWDYANNPLNRTIDDNPSPGGIYTFHYPQFFAPFTRSYTVRMVAYSGDNCLSTTDQTITIKARPQLEFNAVNPVCADVAPFQLTQAAMVNALPGSGVFSGPGVSESGWFEPATAGKGLHTIRYTFNGANGCSNFIEQTINVFEVPVANAGPDRFALEGGTVTLLGSSTLSNVSYLWTPSNGLNNAAVAQPVVSPLDDITYRLTVTTTEGCTDSDDVFVKLLKAPLVPNTFSPNGDGIHDRWEIKYLESYPGCIVQIYNRYGQIIFESKGYSKPWDGTFKGKEAPAGTYYYIIDPKNGRKQITGFVDIIR